MRAVALTVVLAVAGCGGSGTPDGLRAGDGDAGFVRCLAADPPEERRFRVGGLGFAQRGRTLQIDGAPEAPEVEIAAGPAPSTAPLGEVLATLAGSGRAPDLIVVLGSLGDDAGTARRHAADLAAAPAPVLFVAGGRDDPETIDAALRSLPAASRGRVIDATSLRRIVLGDDVLVPLAGAPGGRYARSRNACGFATADVDAVVREAAQGGRPGERRWLLSWAAPPPQPGLDGVEAGSPLVARVVRGLGPRAVFAAWPDGGAALGLRGSVLIAPPLAGTVLRPDGSRAAPSPTRVTLGAHGPLIAPLAPPPPPRR